MSIRIYAILMDVSVYYTKLDVCGMPYMGDGERVPNKYVQYVGCLYISHVSAIGMLKGNET